METRKLQHLIELASTGSFSRAAENLHLTQSALSKSIQSLEEELDTHLVDRQGRRVTLTTAGELVVNRAQRLLVDLDDLHKVVRQDAGPEGQLRIGFGAGPGAALTPAFICHVLNAYPRVRLLIRRGTADALLRELRERTIDAVVIDMRSLAGQDDLVVERVGALEGGAVCRTGHPLTFQTAVGFPDVLNYPTLNTAVSDEVVRLTQERYGPLADLRRVTAVESEELEPLLAACVHSDAVFLGVVAAARERIAQGALQVLPLTPPLGIDVPIALVRLAGRGESRLVQIVRAFATDWLHRPPPERMARNAQNAGVGPEDLRVSAVDGMQTH
jgi:DNA-binding transcriptional LysR family regulator